MSSLTTRLALGAATLTFFAGLPAASMPRLMDLYNAHPRATVANRDKCVVCHTNANGSGRLTTFGEKYEHQGLEFTESLMNEYPNLFAAAGSSSAGNEASNGSSNPGPPSESKAQTEAAAPLDRGRLLSGRVHQVSRQAGRWRPASGGSRLGHEAVARHPFDPEGRAREHHSQRQGQDDRPCRQDHGSPGRGAVPAHR